MPPFLLSKAFSHKPTQVCIYMLGCYDNIGGCCIIHLFGACFGIGATIFASQKVSPLPNLSRLK